MILDALLQFSDAQALTATAVSTNVVDLGAARGIGIGRPLAVLVSVDVAAGGTTPTLAVSLQTDSVVGFGSAATLFTSNTYAQAALTAGARFAFPLPIDRSILRFVRLSYTLGGTTPTVTVTAFLQPADMIQAEQYFPGSFTIQP